MATFSAPDNGPGRTPYCCSFHWFRLPDDTIAGVDIIRNGDEWSLRMFSVDAERQISGTLVRVPHVEVAESQRIYAATDHVGFDLDIAVHGEVHDTGRFLLNLGARDYPLVRYTGIAHVSGHEYEVNSFGPASVHYGKFLTTYGYLTTLPPQEKLVDRLPRLLLAATGRDNFPRWLPLTNVTYGYGANGVPSVRGRGQWQPRQIVVGDYRISLLVGPQFEHELLGERTITALALAKLYHKGAEMYLGEVIVDVRGQEFVKVLA